MVQGTKEHSAPFTKPHSDVEAPKRLGQYLHAQNFTAILVPMLEFLLSFEQNSHSSLQIVHVLKIHFYQ